MASKKLTLEELDKKMAQMAEQRKDLLREDKAKKERDRVHRLIELGGHFEKFFKVGNIEEGKILIEELAKRYGHQEVENHQNNENM